MRDITGDLAYLGVELRALDRIKVDDGCWEWAGAIADNGYGVATSHDGRYIGAHRLVYELLVGPIPDGLQIDHLCRNTRCVRPGHLEPVTPRVNTLRGVSFTAVNAAKTTCSRGHPFDEDNTYRPPGASNQRHCRACKRAREQENRAHITARKRARRAAIRAAGGRPT